MLLHTPGMSFGQVVGVGIDLVNGEESRPCSSCKVENASTQLHITSYLSQVTQDRCFFPTVYNTTENMLNVSKLY